MYTVHFKFYSIYIIHSIIYTVVKTEGYSSQLAECVSDHHILSVHYRLVLYHMSPFCTLDGFHCTQYNCTFKVYNMSIYQTLSIWLGTQFSRPNLELGPLHPQVLNLTWSIDKKKWILQWKKCTYKADIKQKYFLTREGKHCFYICCLSSLGEFWIFNYRQNIQMFPCNEFPFC